MGLHVYLPYIYMGYHLPYIYIYIWSYASVADSWGVFSCMWHAFICISLHDTLILTYIVFYRLIFPSGVVNVLQMRVWEGVDLTQKTWTRLRPPLEHEGEAYCLHKLWSGYIFRGRNATPHMLYCWICGFIFLMWTCWF